MIRVRKRVTSEDEFVREIVGSVIWDQLYHERELPPAQRHLATIQEICKRLGVGVKGIEAGDAHDGECATVAEYMQNEYAGALDTVAHHETEMRNAAGNFAWVKAMLIRGNYDVDLDQIRAEQAKRLEPKNE